MSTRKGTKSVSANAAVVDFPSETAQPAHLDACLTVVWLNEQSDHLYEAHVLRAVKSQHGVVAVDWAPSEPLMMLVRFDASQTRADTIVAGLEALGYDAALIEC